MEEFRDSRAADLADGIDLTDAEDTDRILREDSGFKLDVLNQKNRISKPMSVDEKDGLSNRDVW